MTAGDDAPLRLRALDVLGPAGDPLAREALEHGAVDLEPHALAWESSHGHVTGVRVVLRLSPELRARVAGAPAVGDALVAALAAAVAETPGRSLVDLVLGAPEGASAASPARRPYR